MFFLAKLYFTATLEVTPDKQRIPTQVSNRAISKFFTVRKQYRCILNPEALRRKSNTKMKRGYPKVFGDTFFQRTHWQFSQFSSKIWKIFEKG